MNYDRIYEYRFAGIGNEKKNQAWFEIAEFIYKKLDSPNKILDPAAGFCEFINNVPSEEKWVIDLNEPFINKYCKQNINKLIGNNLEVEIPENYFDGIFVSNFLEHLYTQEQITLFLGRMYKTLKPGGKIYLSDIVLLKELTAEQRNNKELLSGCVAGALLRDDYLDKIKGAGFKVRILYENKEISKKQYNGIPLESIMVELEK